MADNSSPDYGKIEIEGGGKNNQTITMSFQGIRTGLLD